LKLSAGDKGRTQGGVQLIRSRFPTAANCSGSAAEQRETGKRCSVFHMSMGVFEHIGRGVVVYAFLFFLLRFAGKKHVGQLAPFDLVVLLILSETVQNSLIGDDTSLVGGLISAATLVGLSYGMSVLTNYSKFAERLLEGTPKILVRHGRRRKDEMDRQRISLAELTEALRHQGCTNITQVRAAILENDGKITVITS
jgi:uncharacterized membrane protein YcaP (DUF421 family)